MERSTCETFKMKMAVNKAMAFTLIAAVNSRPKTKINASNMHNKAYYANKILQNFKYYEISALHINVRLRYFRFRKFLKMLFQKTCACSHTINPLRRHYKRS